MSVNLPKEIDCFLLAAAAHMKAVDQATQHISSASKGAAREQALIDFLSQVFPWRFGSGDIIDTLGRKSGQIDIVGLTSRGTSLGLSQNQLHLADGVAFAIESKSKYKQWDEAAKTAEKLSALRTTHFAIERDVGGQVVKSPDTYYTEGYPIPFFIVFFKGPANLETLTKRVLPRKDIHGALSLDPLMYMSSHTINTGSGAEGGLGLWLFLNDLHHAHHSRGQLSFDLSGYFSPDVLKTRWSR